MKLLVSGTYYRKFANVFQGRETRTIPFTEEPTEGFFIKCLQAQKSFIGGS